MQAFKEYLDTGGIFIYPILLFSIWAFVLILERIIFYLQTASRTTKMQNLFFEILNSGGIDNAKKYLQKKSGILKIVLLEALNNHDLPNQKIEKKIDSVLLKHLPNYQKFLNLIATLGGLMPMLGLLGTVTGMIATFKVIALQGTGDAQAMADGISEALITTQAGLVAAVPIILGHTFLTNRLHKITSIIKESVTKLLDYLEDQKEMQK